MDNIENTSQDIDLNEILGDNGISEIDFNDDVTVDIEDSEESHNENQGEGNNGFNSLEEALEETREDFQQALDEATEITAVPASAIETSEEALLSNPEPTPENTEAKKTIPLNSPTLLIDDTTSRFSGAEWFEEIKKSKIIIAGVGGIGRI